MALPNVFAVYREDVEPGSLQLLQKFLSPLATPVLRNKLEENQTLYYVDTYKEQFCILPDPETREKGRTAVWNERAEPGYLMDLNWKRTGRMLLGDKGTVAPILEVNPFQGLPRFWPKVALVRRFFPQLPEPEPLPGFVCEALLEGAIRKGQMCPITMETFQLGHTAVTTCFHLFSRTALETWRSSHGNECPVCKKKGLVALI